MNGSTAFSVVVFPEAVSPETSMDIPDSSPSQMYAAIWAESVFHLINWIMDMVSSANFLIVNEEPWIDTSSL